MSRLSPIVGPQLWSSSFLPAVYQGTYIPNSEKTPDKLVQYIRNTEPSPAGTAPPAGSARQTESDLSCSATATTRSSKPASSPPRSPSACRPKRRRCSTSKRKPEKSRARYGDSDFGRGCLMALPPGRKRRPYGPGLLRQRAALGQPRRHPDPPQAGRTSRRPASPLCSQDLKASGLLNETLVIIGGEFGRTPVVEVSGLVKVSERPRPQQPRLFDGARGRRREGRHGLRRHRRFRLQSRRQTRPYPRSARHCAPSLGLDHTKLTYRYSGRDFRLTDVAGDVVTEILV